jgi:hypothetical protein
MRLEFNIEMEKVNVPRFSVEAVEGIGKLFTLATLVLNVLDSRDKIEIVFHGLSPDDPKRKIEGFREIVTSSQTAGSVDFNLGANGQVHGSSSYYQWLEVVRA